MSKPFSHWTERNSINDRRIGRPWLTRRGFLQSGAAVMAGLPGRLGHAADIPNVFDGSKFQLKTPGTRS
jgi:hypothetical protein